MKISRNGKVTASTKKRIFAAGEDDIEYMQDDTAVDDISDMIDDMSEPIVDEEVAVDEELNDEEVADEIEEDETDIEIENNIANHFIAECDSCHGVFISALVETDQEVDMLSGVCPLCGKETDQYLKWIIREV